MMRFDIIQQYRKGIISIFNSLKTKPDNLIYFLPLLLDSIILMLKYAKFPSKGLVAQLQVKGVLIVYILTFFVWKKDSTTSLEKTMIALDNYLDQAGKIMKYIY